MLRHLPRALRRAAVSLVCGALVVSPACGTAEALVEMKRTITRVERVDPSLMGPSEPPSWSGQDVVVQRRIGTRERRHGTQRVVVLDADVRIARDEGDAGALVIRRGDVDRIEVRQDATRLVGLAVEPTVVSRSGSRPAPATGAHAHHDNVGGTVLLGLVGGVVTVLAVLVAIECADGCFH